MTRHSLQRTIARLYVFLGIVLAISLLAKFADYFPFLDAIGIARALKDGYEYIKDMSLLIATGGVAYVSNVYQKRSNFVTSLETEWRNIVSTKNALYTFCEKAYPTPDDYLEAFCRLSATIDNMRIVYRNVGETDDLIGLYPYAPLHDMRRSLQTLDPRKVKDLPPEYRKLVRDAILQSFYALRETFLEELDLEQPGYPLLISGGRRNKRPGQTTSATRLQERQRATQDTTGNANPNRREDIDSLLVELYQREQKA